MAVFCYKTKNSSDPNGKPRVYFTCHPADFDRFFSKILEDILTIHDCAVYYTENMSETIEEENLETDLGRMNLFVVPITACLLTTDSRAMHVDIAYAKKEHIPILPLMMEPGLDAIYAKPENFGQSQYLSPCSKDTTEISYMEKLKKYLDTVLIGDALAKRIRAAFDAYIFLSYRKKDRRYANELMKLIHKNPECRDIAIWFDEFLTPGKSFADGIQKALGSSKLFTLLVTPSLLELSDGKPNFVMAQEYPAAQKLGKSIFPVEMQPTDREALAASFAGIPNCVELAKEEDFRQQLLQAIQRIAVTANHDDPEHVFLIGMAYLEGIDVETDRTRGISLITHAANEGLPEAMQQMMRLFSKGRFVPQSITRAIAWGEKLLAHYENTEGGDPLDTVNTMRSLADLYCDNRNYQKAVAWYQRAYAVYCAANPQASDFAAEILADLAHAYRFTDWTQAIQTRETVYRMKQQLHGPEHEQTRAALHFFAKCCYEAKAYPRAAALFEQLLAHNRKELGDAHPATLSAMNGLALVYTQIGELHKAQALLECVCEHSEIVFSQNHKSTGNALQNLASVYEKLGQYVKAVDTYAHAYWSHVSAFQANRSELSWSRDSLIRRYKKYGMYVELIAFLEKAYDEIVAAEGEASDHARKVLQEIAMTHKAQKHYAEALQVLHRQYDILYKADGSHAFSGWSYLQDTLKDLSDVYELSGDLEKAQFYAEKKTVLKHLSVNYEKDPFLWSPLRTHYAQCGDRLRALELLGTEYTAYCRKGQTDPDALDRLGGLVVGYIKMQKPQTARVYLDKILRLQRRYLEEDHPALGNSLQVLAALSEKEETPQKTAASETSNPHEELPESIAELKALVYGKTPPAPEQMLRIREKLHRKLCQESGEMSSEALCELQKLAANYNSCGDHSRAAQLLQKAHDLAVAVMGSNYLISFDFHADFVLQTLAQYYMQSGNTRKWVETAQLRYQFNLDYRGKNSDKTHKALKDLALVYQKTDEHAKAVELLEGEYARKTAPEAKPQEKKWMVQSLLQDLSYAQLLLGNYERAAELLEKLYAEKLESDGREHDKTITVLSNLSYAYTGMGDHQKALTLQQEVYDLRVKISGEEAQKSITALYSLAICYTNVGEHQTYLELSIKAYNLCCKVFGETHLQSLKLLNNLSIAYSWVSNYSMALEMAQKAHIVHSRVYGEQHSQTVKALYLVARCHESLADYQSAADVLETVCRQRQQIHGAEHPDTVAAQRELAEIRRKLKESLR